MEQERPILIVVPVGNIVGDAVPLGVGLVLWVGLSEGVQVAVADREPVKELDRVWSAVGELEAVAVWLALGLGLGDREAEKEREAVGVSDGEGEREGEGDGFRCFS